MSEKHEATIRAALLDALAALDGLLLAAEELAVVLQAAHHYYPKDTPMSESMEAALQAWAETREDAQA